jgi:hypothetical protein
MVFLLRRIGLVAFAWSVSCATSAATDSPGTGKSETVIAPTTRTYANPVDVDYRYNFEQLNERISYRTGADPVIVRHGDAYYLFMTTADGYWRSTNLLDWQFITPDRWPLDGMVAPAVASDGDRLLLMRAMFMPGPVFASTDPAHGHFDFVTRRTPELPKVVPPGWDRDLPAWHNGDPEPEKIAPGPWDPDLFKVQGRRRSLVPVLGLVRALPVVRHRRGSHARVRLSRRTTFDVRARSRAARLGTLRP